MGSLEENQNGKDTKRGLGHYFGFREVLTYFFRKKDPDRPSNFNIRAMHRINKISIIMFLICVIIIIMRRLF